MLDRTYNLYGLPIADLEGDIVECLLCGMALDVGLALREHAWMHEDELHGEEW